MKKLLVVLLVLAFVAPAMADDMLDVSGTMRVRAWNVTNPSYAADTDDDEQYWDQRFRMQGVITPADGVKAVFRLDFTENVWGGNTWTGSRYSAGVAADGGDISSSEAGELQVDRAYLDVTKGMFNIVAGEAYFGLGNNYAYDNNQTGLAITLKTPVTVRVAYLKIDEDPTGTYLTQTNLTDEDGFEDVDHYFIDLGFGTDAFSANVFYVMQADGQDDADEPTMFGAMGKFGVGPMDIMAELNMFGGDNGAGVDYVGTQLYVDAAMKFSDAMTAGLQLIYSDGEDKADEDKIVRFPNAFFGSNYYSDLGPFNTDIAPLGGGDVMDPLDTNSGAMGGGVYANFKPMDAVQLSAQVLYLTGVEDADGMFDSGFVIGVGVDYMLVQNANLALAYVYSDLDYVNDNNDPALDTDSLGALAARIEVAF